MKLNELAGKPAPRSILENIPRLTAAYYTHKPDVSQAAQRVAFGTSGHRGSSLKNSFNEAHILAVSQAICEYRRSKKIRGPLFLGMDTHALSEPAFASAIEVFAANRINVLIQKGWKYTPTPVISHAILAYNLKVRGSTGRSDGVVITPSHNPPGDGGFKYNPPHGGPADEVTTKVDRKSTRLNSSHPSRSRMPSSA
jgi:phosphoglucomutase